MKTAINSGQITANEIIDVLGGTSSVASLLNIKPPSVSDWKSLNTIPDDKLIRMAPHIEVVSNLHISRKFLFPDDWHEIWPELTEQDQKNEEAA